MGQTAVDVANFVMEFAASLRGKNVNLDRIILFGSHARGEASVESDIDLLVVSPDFGKNVLQDYALLYTSLPPHDVDVDALPCTREELTDPEPDSFLATVLDDGKVVYQATNR